MAHRRPISLLISLLFLAIVATKSCANAQENNNELLKDALEMIYRRQNSIENNPQPDETVFLKMKPQAVQAHNYGGIPYMDADEEQQRNDPIDFEQYRHMMDSSSATDDEITLPYEVFYNDNSSPTADDMEQTPKPSKRKHSVFRERTNDGEIIYPKYNEIHTEVPIQNNDNLENELDYMNLLQEYWQRYLAQRQHHRVQQYEDATPSKRNGHLRIPYNIHSDNIVMKKRFPVAKRSSNIPKKTDPKVERDLSNIFGGGSSSSTIQPVDESKKTKTPKKVTISNNNKKNQTKTKSDNLNIKKKSIDWSNYFGIDKRKKKSTPQNEWIIEQYKNTLKQINHINDETTHEQKQRRDDTKLDVIKDKLRNIEDMIIDEALKYTGAHEGADIDSKEIQEVKDKVMSRLAAVYSLEKMRRALGEFKKSIAEQRQQLKANQLNGDFELLETDDSDSNSENHENDSTTTSASSTSNEHVNRIPNKKDVLLHSNQNKDNNIMNQQSDEHIEDCDILEVIQRQCSHLATKAGEQLVQPLCMLHQLCTLCGIDESNDSQQNVIENSDLGCYYMYAAESEHACAGETQCRRRANYALNTLRDVHTRPIFTSDMCPHNAVCIENVLETAKRRLSFSPYIMSRRNI
ncbi:uncharacterized protein LOC123302743 [Chrysoperla carnea]|uniref:uncharacterized protein LOC123302743 n=1 Tax=Chrysoperla carnea TaxID=189513 RepID=UPI001D064552|nr:uncharacterized protein LOC123302743 [Chrysoperla carnea]